MIKRKAAAILAGWLLLAAAPAQAELLFEGKVVAGESVSITAPYGGTLSTLYVREGERVSSGDLIAQVSPRKVFSPLDGTVRGLNAQIGDNAQKTLFFIAPVSKFTVKASVEKAYSSAETKYITVGERLYISCSKDGTHRAEGVVVAVDGLDFTVETDKGELYMEEKVYLYRAADYDEKTRVGYGAVERTKEVAVSGTGSVLRLHVQEGEFVERGQLLFETADATFEAGEIADETVLSAHSGVIGQISAQAGDTLAQGAVIATLYTPESFRVEITVSEEWIREIHTGDAVKITFAAGMPLQRTANGTVKSISYIQTENEETVAYQVSIDFEADADTRLGMSAAVVLGGV